MYNEQIDLAKAHLRNLIVAAQGLSRFWDNTPTEVADILEDGKKYYPSYLPSFDEFVTDLDKWAVSLTMILDERRKLKTLAEFRATRGFYTVVEVISLESLQHIVDDHDRNFTDRVGFFVYDKGCWIAILDNGEFWCPISNYDVCKPTLAEVEEKLYKDHYLYA